MSRGRTLIIAEAGVNHNGSLPRALEMIDAAAEAGADVIKFQTFQSDRVLSRSAPKAAYQRETTPAAESQLEMARGLELDQPAHKALASRCNARAIEFMSAPFDLESVEFLVSELRVSRLKIASGEITNFPLLLKAARSNTPIILSTGMSTLRDVEAALGVLAFGYVCSDRPRPDPGLFEDALRSLDGRQAVCRNVSLLHCTTEYPAPVEDVNLKAINTLNATFSLPVGLSDHTSGIAIPIAAVALGATIIEKHFTLSRELPGPDHRSSLEPDELATMIRAIRDVEAAIGDGVKVPAASERKNLPIIRKSLVAATKISEGETYTEANLTTKRPGSGVSAAHYWQYLGLSSPRGYEEDELIEESPGPGSR
jgi:N-acetylneuraminate synthase